MLRSGGVERWLADLYSHLRSLGIESDFALQHGELGFFGRQLESQGAQIHVLGASSNPLRHARAVISTVRKNGPYSAVHAHLSAFSAFSCLGARLAGVPTVVAHSHNVVNAGSHSLLRASYLATARSLLSMLKVRCLSPSAAALQDLVGRRQSLVARSALIPYGVDFERFQHPLPAAEVRSRLGIPLDALVFGTIGRLAAEKNQVLLVRVLARLLAIEPSAYLVIIGEGPLRDQIEREASLAGVTERVLLPGFVENVPQVMAGLFDVYLHPSAPPPRGNEATPIAVIEAQIAGVPCVVGDGVYDETVLVDALVARVSVDAEPSAWVSALLRQKHLATQSRSELEHNLAAAGERGFDIRVNSLQLAREYGFAVVRQ